VVREKSGNLRVVREKSGNLRVVREKLRKIGKVNENVFLHMVYYREYCCSLLKNTVVIVVTVYASIAVRSDMHFVLYRYCCEGRYSVNIHLKCLEKSGESQGI